jgi:hypothetical protein
VSPPERRGRGDWGNPGNLRNLRGGDGSGDFTVHTAAPLVHTKPGDLCVTLSSAGDRVGRATYRSLAREPPKRGGGQGATIGRGYRGFGGCEAAPVRRQYVETGV